MFNIRILNTLIFLIGISINLFAQFGQNQELVKIETFQSFDRVHAGSELKIAVKADIAEKWHINSNTPNDEFLIGTELTIASETNFGLLLAKYPKHEEIEFAFSDKPVAVFEGEIFVGGIITVPKDLAPGKYPVTISLKYQACNDASCMAPTAAVAKIEIEVVPTSESIAEVNQEIFSNLDLSYSKVVEELENDDDSIAGTLERSGLFFSLLFVFLGGLALNLTPCVYPLIPITVGYFGGQSEGSTGKLFALGVFYVLGMAITYSVVGVVTALSGAVFGTLMQSPIVILAIVALLVALSLSMFGLYEFKMPDSWVAKAGGAKSGVIGALLMGLTMGIVAAPCIGPFVLGLVTYVGVKGDPVYGFLMFFFLALGLGFPYLFLALFSGKIKNLPRAGFWMEAVKHIFGFLLIGMALYFASPLIPKEIDFYILPIFMIGSALYLIFVDKIANDILGFRIFKTLVSVIVLILGIWMLWPSETKAPNWEKDFSIEIYEKALSSNEKIFIDFYADWCIPCKEMDALTFSDERVIEKLNEFKSYKVDMTLTVSDKTEELREKFAIRGMPTYIFINSEGNEVERLTGFVNADEFMKILRKIE